MSAIDFWKMLAEERRKLALANVKDGNEPLPSLKPIVKVAITHEIVDKSEQRKDENSSSSMKIAIEGPLLISDALSPLLLTLPNVSDIFYVPNAISCHTEEALINVIQAEAKSWEVLRGRRLQQWGRIPSRDGRTIDTVMPTWLNTIIDELMLSNIFPVDKRPNNVLINEYERDEGIMHHTDGPLYFDRVVILSLHSDCIMSFKPNLKTHEIGIKSADDVLSMVLQRRSLFVFQGVWYNQYMHGIYPNEEISSIDQHGETANASSIGLKHGDYVPRGYRISITMRTLL